MKSLDAWHPSSLEGGGPSRTSPSPGFCRPLHVPPWAEFLCTALSPVLFLRCFRRVFFSVSAHLFVRAFVSTVSCPPPAQHFVLKPVPLPWNVLAPSSALLTELPSLSSSAQPWGPAPALVV